MIYLFILFLNPVQDRGGTDVAAQQFSDILEESGKILGNYKDHTQAEALTWCGQPQCQFESMVPHHHDGHYLAYINSLRSLLVLHIILH